MADATNAIEATELYRQFGDVRAVEGVTLAVRRGEIYGFLGPNGAGKTTTLRILTTLLLPSSGSARVAGHDVVSDAINVRLKIGTALQEVGLDPKQTGLELLRLQGSLYGLSRRDANRRIEELEHLVDIGDAINRLVGTYSGGMKRRLDLAASLIHSPEALFLDEPTTGLDPISRSRVWEYVRAINKEMGVTIFLTTQYMEEADALAERVGIINGGALSAEGTPAELKRAVGADVIVANVAEPEQARAALSGVRSIQKVDAYENELSISTSDGAALMSDVALALNQGGVKVNSLTLRAPTLDDVFLQVTGARMEAEAEAPQESGRALEAAS